MNDFGTSKIACQANQKKTTIKITSNIINDMAITSKQKLFLTATILFFLWISLPYLNYSIVHNRTVLKEDDDKLAIEPILEQPKLPPTEKPRYIIVPKSSTPSPPPPTTNVREENNKNDEQQLDDDDDHDDITPVQVNRPARPVLSIIDQLNIITKNKTREVIITTATKGFNEMLFNWLCSVQQFNSLSQVLIYVPSEEYANDLYFKYKIPNHQIYAEQDSSIAESVHYRQLDYQMLMVKRTQFIDRVINMDYKILLADNDAVWLNDPIEFIHSHYPGLNENKIDMIVQDDSINYKTHHIICGGFIYLVPTLRMKKLWSRVAKEHANFVLINKEQVPEQKLLNDYKAQYRVKIEYLPMELYPSGKYFFEKFNADERTKAHVVHNNWIVGTDKKLARFKEFSLWLLDENYESSDKKSWRFTCNI
jgi:hypothetical protein